MSGSGRRVHLSTPGDDSRHSLAAAMQTTASKHGQGPQIKLPVVAGWRHEVSSERDGVADDTGPLCRI